MGGGVWIGTLGGQWLCRVVGGMVVALLLLTAAQGGVVVAAAVCGMLPDQLWTHQLADCGRSVPNGGELLMLAGCCNIHPYSISSI